MFSGRVNDISLIHSFLDKTTETMVKDTLNTVRKINIPLKSPKDGRDQDGDKSSRQDGVQTDMNLRYEDQSRQLPSTQKPSILAQIEPHPHHESQTNILPNSGGGTAMSSSTIKNANAIQPFTGIAFGVNSGGASTTRFSNSKAELPQFGMVSSRIANDINSTTRMQELREIDKLNIEVYNDMLASADYVDFPHVTANIRPRSSTRKGYVTKVIDYSK